MGEWKIDTKRMPGVIRVELSGTFSLADMDTFVSAHNRAIDEQHGKDYKVFVDMREMSPLKPEAASAFERAKVYSASHKNFRGSAVWVAKAVVAMQHRRTSVSGGVSETEMIGENEAQLLSYLERVNRQS